MSDRIVENIGGISVRLTAEEIFFMGNQTGIGTLPMVNRETFDEQDEEVQEMVLDVARRGLIARGYFYPDDPEALYHPLISAILGAVTQPEQALGLVIERENQAPKIVQFYTANDVYLMQTMLPEQFVLFELFADREIYVWAIEQIINAAERVNGFKPVQLSMNELEPIYVAGSGRWESLLTSKGLSASAGAEFARFIDQIEETITIYNQTRQADTVLERNFTIFKSDAAAWLLETRLKNEDEPEFELQPYSSALFGEFTGFEKSEVAK